MKRLLPIFTLFLLISTSTLFAQFEGTVGFGAHVGYAMEINSPGIGAHIHYYQTNSLRFAPSFTRFLEVKGKGLLMIDADAHYILPLSVTASIYPILGLHYSNWSYNASKNDEASTDRWYKHRLGSNIGFGFQHDISYRVRANIDLKYQFIKDFSQVMLSAGFGFWF